MAAVPARKRGRPYDPASRKKAVKEVAKGGVRLYIPGEVLRDAGYDPDEPIFYRLNGYARSARAGSVIVSLYREP